MRHYSFLNRYVLNPIRQFGYTGAGREAMQMLRRGILRKLVLRRTKAGRAADLALPMRVVTLRDDLRLDAYEQDFYQALYTQSRAKMGAYVAAGTVLQNYAHLFDLLTRLRQAVCHPYLILHGHAASVAADAAAAASGASSSSSSSSSAARDVCGICRESAEDCVLTGCHHAFCKLCMREYLDGLGAASRSLLKDATNDAAAFIGGDAGAGAEAEAEAAAAAADEDEDGEGGGGDDDDDDDDDGFGKKKKKAKATRPAKRSKKASPSAAAASARDEGAGAVAGAGEAGDGGEGEGGGAAEATCPTCFAPLTVDLLSAPSSGGGEDEAGGSAALRRKSILSRIPSERVGSAFRSSTKIEALLEDLWRAQQSDPGAKAIVFSQFVSMLELIQHRLSLAGVRCVKLDGSMSVAARDRVIAAFRDDAAITVFLISLKAGGVALNLTSANRIYLMDPWWSPAAEMQALDRTHRLGQHRTIEAVRFVVAGTVEERIIALQRKKQLVFDATVGGGGRDAVGRLTADDMRFLFS